MKLLHDILAYEVVGRWSTPVKTILNKEWVRRRSNEIEWAPTAAGLGSIKKKLARLLCDEERDEDNGALLDKVVDACAPTERLEIVLQPSIVCI